MDETLKGLLEMLRWAEGSSPLPPGNERLTEGLWVVKWLQGAVAAGATRANINVRKGGVLEIDLHGNFSTSCRRLADQVESHRLPQDRAERHLVQALRQLRGRGLGFKVMSRHGNRKHFVAIGRQGGVRVYDEPYEGGSGTLSVTVAAPRNRPLWVSAWASEEAALKSRMRYCAMPITLGKSRISQAQAYDRPKVLMNWIESATGDELAFPVNGDPRQILSPGLIKPDNPVVGTCRCSIMLTLSASALGAGLARVWWIRDGALVGPIRLVGPTGAANIAILCPGDRPGMEMSEWAAREPFSFFPDKLVLTVVRRLAGGLDSLIPELAARASLVEKMMREMNALTGYRNWLPVSGKPWLALAGPFHTSVKAFSLRQSLELST